ncbi:MAG TPA: hypothetical protein VFN05_12665 [Actinomycetes bacterium]|nr:hypothetical protein [Actinomycetes bacterium]
MKARRLLRSGGATAAAGLVACAAWTAVAWARYGHTSPGRHPPDGLLDQLIPNPEVDEYHQLEVDAPAPITFAVAKGMDLQASPIVKAIFWLRAVPAMLRGQPSRPRGPRGLLEETLALGFGVLAEIPDRKILVGTYTQPWHQQVTFHPLPPEKFAGFDEPGYVKIVYTLAAEPLGPDRSRFVTRTRVVTTDAEARRRFRRYWAPMSAGILLIRYLSLPMVKRQAERRTERPSATPAPWGIPRSGTTSHRRWSSRCAS